MLTEFLEKFPAKEAVDAPVSTKHLKQTMTKARAKDLIDTGMRSKYPATVCRVLRHIVETIPASGGEETWHDFDIQKDEDRRSSSPPGRIAKKAGVSRRTFLRAMRILNKDGLIVTFRGAASAGHDQYAVHLDDLEDLPVKVYKSEKSRKAYDHARYLSKVAAAKEVQL